MLKTLRRSVVGCIWGTMALLATVDDCSSVAAQVHCETSVVAVRPIDTLPPASNALSRFS